MSKENNKISTKDSWEIKDRTYIIRGDKNPLT